MNKTTLAALKASIRHWERMRDNKPRGREGPYVNHCALCKRFYELNCEGCPVKDMTGRPECNRSPYYQAQGAYYYHGFGSPQFREAAQAEIDFLKSLLPKDADT